VGFDAKGCSKDPEAWRRTIGINPVSAQLAILVFVLMMPLI
jgi:hypothetical protein